MSAYHIVKKLEEDAKKDDLTYSLEIRLRSGHVLVGDPYKANSYYLLLDEETVSAKGAHEHRHTYLAWEAIDQVTPLWH